MVSVTCESQASVVDALLLLSFLPRNELIIDDSLLDEAGVAEVAFDSDSDLEEEVLSSSAMPYRSFISASGVGRPLEGRGMMLSFCVGESKTGRFLSTMD